MLDASAVREPPGAPWSRAWTDAVDAALVAWLGQASLPDGVAVVGLGSYARRQLCPASDVDLLLLHDGWRERDLAALVEALCYPLWDAGLSVGHAVRTAKEAVRAGRDRIDSATALTDRRLVAGAGHLLDDLAARTRRWLRSDVRHVLGGLSAADAERHRRAGPTAGMLEPDVKAGAGGLRDVQSLRWAAACLLGEVGLDPLVAAGYLGAGDRHELAAAGNTLLAARCALHLVAGRGGGDVLRLDLQDEVAGRLGLRDGDELLQRVGLAMRAVAHLHGRTWPLLLADARGGRRRRRPATIPSGRDVVVVDGQVETAEWATAARDPSLALRAVAVAAEAGTHLGRRTAVRLRADLAGRDQAWDERGRTALLATLRAGSEAALADADYLGLWSALLPEWQRVRGRRQRNPFHRFDLDTHGVTAVVQLSRVIGELPEVWERIEDPDAVLLATWLHDVGKAWPGDHSEAGEAVVRDLLRHAGFAEPTVARAAALVRHHLALPRAATRRDLDDADELAAVAAAVGDADLLDGLYLLTLADARATGPSASSPWKERLIATLHARVRRILAGRQPFADDESRLADARAAVDPRQLDLLLDGAPRRYLVAAAPAQLARHAALLPLDETLRARVDPGPSSDTLVLSVVARDRLGLIADCAGVLAGHGVAVLDARAFTRADGVALDWFTCGAAAARWEDVIADLRAAADGRLDVAALVERRERRRDVRLAALPAPVPVRVVMGNGRIEVTGSDAPGLLYRLGRVLADAGWDVAGARVATLGPELRDVFLVRPPPAADPDAVAAALERAAVPPDHVRGG